MNAQAAVYCLQRRAILHEYAFEVGELANRVRKIGAAELIVFFEIPKATPEADRAMDWVERLDAVAISLDNAYGELTEIAEQMRQSVETTSNGRSIEMIAEQKVRERQILKELRMSSHPYGAACARSETAANPEEPHPDHAVQEKK